MKNNPLDDLVRCDIEISSPASSDETFDSILLVVAPPTEENTSKDRKVMRGVTAISQADELLEYGYAVEDAAYAAATVAFSQSPSPDELLICVRKKSTIEEPGTKEPEGEHPEVKAPEEENLGTKDPDSEDSGENLEGISTEGTLVRSSEEERNSGETWEDIRSTLSRAKAEAGFYGIHLTEFKDAESVAGAVEWAEANEKLFAFEYTDDQACPVQNCSYYRSFGLYSGSADGYEEGTQPKENLYAALAWMAKCFGYDPGTETWHLKELASIVPSALSSDQKKELEAKHINTFRRYAGCNVSFGGYTLAGEWIDVIRFRDWLKAEIQINVFNALKTNRKVPYTDAGIGLIEGKIEETLLRGQTIGGIAGDAYDDERLIRGYTVDVPMAANLTEAERKTRCLPGCRFTARLAGAIHVTEIGGYLTF